MDLKALIATIRTPKQESGPAPIDLEAKAVQLWRDALPLANLQETTRRVFLLLKMSNRLILQEKQRITLLETLRPTIDYISQALSKGCQGVSLPLPEKVARLVLLNEELLAEAAIGHKILLQEWLPKRFLFGAKERLLVESIQATLHYYDHIALEAYRTYVPYPSHFWDEVHALYALAEARNLDREKSTSFSAKGQLSIADTYKRMVLLALASPYHLEQGTIGAMHQRLADWCSLTRFQRIEEFHDDEVKIVIHLASTRPPEFRVLNQSREKGNEYRVLDAGKLLIALEKEIEKARKSGPARNGSQRLSAEQMTVLHESWSGPTTRSDTRYQEEVGARISVGLNAAFHNLRDPERSNDQKPFNNNDSLDLEQDESTELLKPDETAAAWTELRSSVRPEAVSCQTLDFSANGCQLMIKRGTKITIHVGDLLTIGIDNAPGRWKLGTVRWIRQLRNGDTQIGARILQGKGLGVVAAQSSDEGELSNYSECVRLSHSHGETLLTPRMPFAKQDLVAIGYKDPEFVRLGGNSESGSRFAHFQFRAVREEMRRQLQEHRSAKENIPVADEFLDPTQQSGVEEILEDDSGIWEKLPRDW